MTISIIEPKSLTHSDRKHYHNGKKVDYYGKPKKYNLIKTIPRTQEENELDNIEAILREQEANEKDWVLLFEAPITNERECQATANYFENDILRYVIQLDFDGTYKGANSLPIEERIEIAKQLCPMLEGVDCVAHLSNKAGYVEHYPDHLALRLYVELDERLSNPNLRKCFKPYGLGTAVGIDHTLFSNRRKHLIQLPSHSGNNPPRKILNRIYRTGGGKLKLAKAMRSQHYLDALALLGREEKALNDIPTTHKDLRQVKDTKLHKLADEGFFDKVSRYEAHYRIIAQANWKNQNADKIIELMLADPRILGSKTREKLESQLDYVHTKSQEYFDEDITLKEYDFKIEKNVKDLKDTDSIDLEREIKNALSNKKPLGLICKSPHGSGKTMYLMPLIWNLLRNENKGRKITMAYISGLKSITQSTTTKLRDCITDIECYIDEDGEIQLDKIENSDCLSIGLKSIRRLTRERDLIFVDESEEAGFWTTWKDTNSLPYQNELIRLLGKSKVFVLADADASTLTYSMATRAIEFQDRLLGLFHNEGSWIEATTLTLYDKREQALQKIVELSKDGKLTFVPVDYAKDTLLATVNALNKCIGETKVVGFCSQQGCTLSIKDGYKYYGKQGLSEIRNRPEETIDYLIEKGFTTIVVSPTIVKGWRYNSDKYRFDATVSDYIWGNHTAPTIIQRTQRCVGVTEHYAHIPMTSSWINADRLNRLLYEEMENSVWGNKEDIAKSQDRHQKEIEIEAETLLKTHKSNIRLHTYYLWQQFGGAVCYEEYQGKALKEITRLVNDIKKQLLLERVEDIMENEELLNFYINYFQTLRGRKIDKENKEDVLEIVKAYDKYSSIKIDIEQTLRCLFTTGDKAREWDLMPPYWNEREMPDRDKLKESLTNDEAYNFKLWQLLDLLNREIWKLNNKDMREIFTDNKTHKLALYIPDIKDTEYHSLFCKYRDLYTTKLKSLQKYRSPTTFLAKLFETILFCKVKNETPKDKTILTHKLIESYMRLGKIKKSKQLRPHKNAKVASKILCERIMTNKRLTDIEKDYINNSGCILVIDMPELIPHELREKLEICRNEYQRIINGEEREVVYEM